MSKFFKNKIFFILATAITIYLILWIFDFSNPNQQFGITFSQTYSQALGLNPQKVYLDILNELNFKKIRLVAYWNEIEKEKDNFNFDNLDFFISQAQKRNKEIILAIGFRVPRWPECHIPKWAEYLKEDEFQKRLFIYLEKVVNRYKNNSSISVWQVENEPFLEIFGKCPPSNKNLFEKEINFVRKLDPTRPILVTDSGELSMWWNTAGKSEIFGTTLYRIVWNKYSGFFKHYLPPSIYALRAWMVKKFTNTKKVIIAELQAEPWIPNSSYDAYKQTKIFTLENLKENIAFARKTGISEIYLWGVEWWYWQKEMGNPVYWQEMVKFFQN